MWGPSDSLGVDTDEAPSSLAVTLKIGIPQSSWKEAFQGGEMEALPRSLLDMFQLPE